MTELRFSNSMIEAWWRALKHHWSLYLNTLDSVEKVRKLIGFYVEEHNHRLPDSAFRGQTPDEMYFGFSKLVSGELQSAKEIARQTRLERKRALSCAVCEPPHAM